MVIPAVQGGEGRVASGDAEPRVALVCVLGPHPVQNGSVFKFDGRPPVSDVAVSYSRNPKPLSKYIYVCIVRPPRRK